MIDWIERLVDHLAWANRRVLEAVRRTGDDRAREVDYTNSSGERFRTPLGEILLHVTHHGEHHRGQIARAVRRAGDEPVNTDFITFVRERAVGGEKKE